MKLGVGVIPARYASTRFPGKPLASLDGKPLLEHVWRRAVAAKRLERVLVATDDDRIEAACRAFGAEVVRTSPRHPTGTDRVAEALAGLAARHEIVLNVQGDEPLVSPSSLDRLVAAFDGPDPPDVATLVEPLTAVSDLFDPNQVKVVAARDGRALYFSRSPIPFHRGAEPRLRADFSAALGSRPGGLAGYWKHQGIYAFRRQVLLDLTAMEPSPLEWDEGLEQLRALEAGFTIRVLESDFRSIPVDTPADLTRVAAELAAHKGAS